MQIKEWIQRLATRLSKLKVSHVGFSMGELRKRVKRWTSYAGERSPHRQTPAGKTSASAVGKKKSQNKASYKKGTGASHGKLQKGSAWQQAMKAQLQRMLGGRRIVVISRQRLILLSSCLMILVVLLAALSIHNRGGSPDKPPDVPVDLPLQTAAPEPEPTDRPLEPVTYPVVDLSQQRVHLELSTMRINEPTAWGREIVFSGGNASTIDEPVLVELYVYHLDTGEEQKVAAANVKFGEIYEGRMNDHHVVWLDTDQRGTNVIYEMDRRTGEVKQIKKCSFSRPQLRLFGDNLIWVEQTDAEEYRMYLYNFKSGEPVILETYDSTSAGYEASPPSIYQDVVVWATPHPADPDRTIIKKLDLKQALQLPSEGSTLQGEGAGLEEEGHGMDPVLIELSEFAFYPATNGKAIAWLDHLNPSRTKLKLTLDDGKRIMEVAENVGRIFGIGDDFIAYNQNEVIYLYFWELDRYARLTAEGESGRLSDMCVAGNRVVWYESSNPSQTRDIVMVSTIDASMIE